MVISKDSLRIHISLKKKLKEDLVELAKKQNKSLNKLIVDNLESYNDKEKQKERL
jgi:predicted HicB family RNase H-like nuclease